MKPEQVSEYMQTRVAELLKLLGVEAAIQADVIELEDRHYVQIDIQAEEAGAELIGYHGGRLKSLSQVVSMMLPKTEERYAVLVDINGYRQQRSEFITELANKTMQDAIERWEPVHLEPMSAWERRIVHVAAGERTDITTTSEGEGEERHVVISPVSVV